jgi:hypothetical protein
VDTVIGNNNLIVHQLLEQQAHAVSGLADSLFRRPNGLIIASLRSRNGEALKVAEKLQGADTPTPPSHAPEIPFDRFRMP